MEFATTNGRNNMQDDFTTAESSWDSESRQSPFSTVSDMEDEYCDSCGDDHTCQDCNG